MAEPGTPGPRELPDLSVYVHLPWCVRKCPYCDFNSHAVRGEVDEASYVAALLAEMACGCPVVSTDCPSGPREILEDGAHGPLVPVGDADALGAAILELLASPPDPEGLRRRADDFSVERVARRYLAAMLGSDS
jgi:glycosyltransferase involved in cell wall biosynthesis